MTRRLALAALLVVLALASATHAKIVAFAYAGGGSSHSLTERLTPRRRSFEAPIALNFRHSSVFRTGASDPADRVWLLPIGDVLVQHANRDSGFEYKVQTPVMVTAGGCTPSAAAPLEVVVCEARFRVRPFAVDRVPLSGRGRASSLRASSDRFRFAIRLYAQDTATGKVYGGVLEGLAFVEGACSVESSRGRRHRSTEQRLSELSGPAASQ